MAINEITTEETRLLYSDILFKDYYFIYAKSYKAKFNYIQFKQSHILQVRKRPYENKFCFIVLLVTPQ